VPSFVRSTGQLGSVCNARGDARVISRYFVRWVILTCFLVLGVKCARDFSVCCYLGNSRVFLVMGLGVKCARDFSVCC